MIFLLYLISTLISTTKANVNIPWIWSCKNSNKYHLKSHQPQLVDFVYVCSCLSYLDTAIHFNLFSMYSFLKDLFNYWTNFPFKKWCEIPALYIIIPSQITCIKDQELYENVLKCKCWHLFLGKSFSLTCLTINKA